MKKTLCLIDGSGYIYRAFYAIPAMNRKKDNLPTNAVYGFTSMLMHFFRQNRPDYTAVVFDARRQNFRNEIYPAYKATRREVPEDLIPQFPLIHEAVYAFNLPAIEKDGFEADDIIATYTQKGLQEGLHVQVVSADKDLMQLMGTDVEIYDPMKEKTLDEQDVLKKFFVLPDKVVDVQALAGDTSDNVPGVFGIGPKTAGELIKEYGSLEALYAHIDSLPPSKKKERLLADKENAFISKKLVTLRKDVADLPAVSDLVLKPFNPEQLLAFLDENGFKSLISRIKETGAAGEDLSRKQKEVLPIKYTLIQDKISFEKWLAGVRDRLGVSVVTQSDSSLDLVGLSLCRGNGEACYIPLAHEKTGENKQMDLFGSVAVKKREKQISPEELKEGLFPVLARQDCLKIGHGVKFLIHILSRAFGEDVKMAPFADTQVMAYDTQEASGLSLSNLSESLLDIRLIPKEEVCGKGKGAVAWSDIPLKQALDYSAQQADMAVRLYDILMSALKEQGTETVYTRMDLPLIGVLAQMEKNGILVDKGRLGELSVVFQEKMKILEKEIFEEAGEEFNLNSPAQLGHILFDKMQLSGGKRSSISHQWITDSEVLETLAAEGYKLPEKVLEYRQYTKLLSTYAEALFSQADAQNRIHTTFSQTMTSTGRLSSNNPNLQNIPIRTESGRLIRSAFVAKKGCVLMSADYSQIELRLIADVADVKNLKEAFRQGVDIHAATASQVFGVPVEGMDPQIRRHAKAINFGIIYGISAFGLARQLGISNTEAKAYIDAYFSKYPEIKTYMEKTTEFAKTHGYVLTPFGRRCYTPSFEKGPQRGFAARAAINAPIQGGAADLIKMAMVKIPDALEKAGLNAKMLLQVHDELVFEVPREEIEPTKKLIKDMMEQVVSLSVPLKVEVGWGENWTEAH